MTRVQASAGPVFQMGWARLARHIGLPTQGGAFATGSWSSDWRRAWRVAVRRGGVDDGPELLMGAGLRGGGRIFSPIAMLLDAELFDLIRRIPLGFARTPRPLPPM